MLIIHSKMATKEGTSYESYDAGKGLVLSITNSIFGKLDESEQGNIKYRQGSELDLEEISACFKGSSLDVTFRRKNNATKYDMKRAIKDVKSTLKRDKSFKFLIILIGSHGKSENGKTYVFDVDNDFLDVDEDLIQPFYNHQFPEFSGRPKIFFINCCRGVLPYRFEPKHDGGIKASVKRPLESLRGDMCIVWSTTDGSLSLRMANRGSPLIQTLCQMVMDKAKCNSLSSTEFAGLLNEVQWKVAADSRVQIVVDNKLAKPFYLTLTG